MQISFIYVLITAEILLLLSGLCAALIFLLVRKQKKPETIAEPLLQQSEEELDTIDLSNSYIDFLEQQIERNSKKLKQVESSEEESPSEQDISAETENAAPPSRPPDEQQSELLQAREAFLLIEKEAADKTEHEIHFWDSLYAGIKGLLEKYKNTQESTDTVAKTTDMSTHRVESEEKVFYIETQGKKIDGEVNKLKDIIHEQENALSGMKKAMASAEAERPDESAAFDALRKNMQAIERQLNDSKMCMEVLEMENDRLQEEVDKMNARHNSLFEEGKEENAENDSLVDLKQMKEVVEQQELKIQQLIESIESLEIDTSQAEKLKATISDFSRTSREMMSCIVILEEENERLQAAANSSPDTDETTAPADEGEIDNIRSQVSSLEEALIKKDVAYAKLQDEFSSMETEYLAMYEAMHGNNG
ncbi:Membrane-associated zinc metalloprotease [hydrothermal vent metagenome]|uniref:Membrane-associated zinc metalloprotease n=1 Tax=hydrothermal vent metagenome TaxID=652676 RepID=A0A3B0X9Z5_9ZZZZ